MRRVSKLASRPVCAGLETRTTAGLPPQRRRPVVGDPGLETGATGLEADTTVFPFGLELEQFSNRGGTLDAELVGVEHGVRYA